ncbi:MAG: MoaD/ThiS family protein [Candidatus Euphemobacter frigidus]|nr:MoaD/ThiS family protein [Candidatus Euphemobacter frigidus]MDP8276673.1 MoaD/ThiS family protein [Candidatus Euphemobacter frigidus]
MGVNLYGIFRKYAKENKFKVEIDPGTSVEGLMRKLKIPKMIYMMVLVNQLKVQFDHPLSPGDEVHIFQPIGGG